MDNTHPPVFDGVLYSVVVVVIVPEFVYKVNICATTSNDMVYSGWWEPQRSECKIPR